MAHVCALCGSITFNTYQAYEDHNTLCHGVKPKIKATVAPSRTREEITRDAELGFLKQHIVTTKAQPTFGRTQIAPKPHNAYCTCMACFSSEMIRLCDAVIKDLDIISNAVTLKQ